MKLAITIWNNRVSPVFDVAAQILVIDKDNSGKLSRDIEKLPSDRIGFLKQIGVNQLICGAISKNLYFEAENRSIKVHPFVAGDVEDVIKSWQDGSLNDLTYSMPGCRRGRCRNHGRRNNNCLVVKTNQNQ